MPGQGGFCLLGDLAMLLIEREYASTKKSENTMQRLALTLLAIGLMSVTAVAQSSTKTKCPRGYDLIGTACQNSATGDPAGIGWRWFALGSALRHRSAIMRGEE
jgi:hypothetical protein